MEAGPSRERLLQTLVEPTQARVSAAQLCQQNTFAQASTQALDVLGDVIIHCEGYLVTKEIARRSKSAAESCGRAECNLQDMLCAVQMLLGLKVKDLKEHIAAQRNSGFPFARGQVPIYREVPWRQRREAVERREEEEQIPDFFPPFPPAHTFTYTPVEVTRSKDTPSEKTELAQEKRALEDRLAALLAQEPSSLPAAGPEPQPNPFLSPVNPASKSFLDSL